MDAAISSLLARDLNDFDNNYCHMLAARMLNFQILHDLVTSSPIFASNRSFPRLEDIRNQYSILASDPLASSKLVKVLLAKKQTKIPNFVNRVINVCQNSERINKMINVSIFYCKSFKIAKTNKTN